MEAKLVVVGGDVKTSEIKLKLPTIIGRGKGATLLLQHPLVSRQHCEIYEHEGQLVVRDLGSLNGTFVNNTRLTEPTMLPSGDLLSIGDVTFRAEYFVDPNLKPPEGPKTARIASLPTSAQVKQPSAPPAPAARKEKPAQPSGMPDFTAFDDEEIPEEVADSPHVASLDEIPAISESDDDFADDMLAVLDVEEVEEEKPLPASLPIKPPPKKPEPKPEKTPEKSAKPEPPASKGKPGAAADVKGHKSGGSSRWAVPSADENETLRAPNKPAEKKSSPAVNTKSPEPPKPAPLTPAQSQQADDQADDEAAEFLASLGLGESNPYDLPEKSASNMELPRAPQASAPPAADEIDATAFFGGNTPEPESLVTPENDAADFLASLGLDDDEPGAKSPSGSSHMQPEMTSDYIASDDFAPPAVSANQAFEDASEAIEDVEDIAEIEDVEEIEDIEVVDVEEIAEIEVVEDEAPLATSDELTRLADPVVEASDVVEQEPEAAAPEVEVEEPRFESAFTAEPVIEPLPAVDDVPFEEPPQPEAATTLREDDVAAFLKDMAASAPVEQAAAESVEEVEAAVEEAAPIEDVEFEDLDIEEVEVEVEEDLVAESEVAPLALEPPAATISPPAPETITHPTPAPPPAAAPPARRPHAAPRPLPGQQPPPRAAAPAAPAPVPTPAPAPVEPAAGSATDDDDLSSFLKGLGP